MKKVLVIGNGFDLDLDLKTGYSDYLESKEFNSIPDDNILKTIIKGENSKSKWVDLEYIIKSHAESFSKKRMIDIKKERNDFSVLNLSLQSYLSNIEMRPLSNRNAAKLLRSISQCADYEIFSFNYTDLALIANNVGAEKIEYKQIHGDLNSGIVLGCEEITTIANKFSFVLKSFAKNYRSNTLSYSLNEAEEIIFYGHSFGASDFNYFNRFLAKQANHDIGLKSRKIITIFTKDHDSLLEIFNNFRAMGINVEYLRADNELNIFYTQQGIHTQEIEKYCNRIINNTINMT